VLSHRSAAALWGIRRWRGGKVDVTTSSSRRQRPGITWHVTNLPADEITSLAAIPLTTVPRTLLDLAAVLDHRGMELAINEAEVRRYADQLSLPALLERHPRRRGAATIRAILAAGGIGTMLTRSELEERFLRFVALRGLPRPQLNAPIAVRGGFVEVDCVWRRARLIAELDGRAVHGTASAFERDRARDRALNAAGWRVVRITWRAAERRGSAARGRHWPAVGNTATPRPRTPSHEPPGDRGIDETGVFVGGEARSTFGPQSCPGAGGSPAGRHRPKWARRDPRRAAGRHGGVTVGSSRGRSCVRM
jgi:hypothetical protein